ncbi:MAG: hypothetical protein JW818_19955 [Pirellulales bacterium]|nr:hypothetical protein [Pirellulales bacterium]
MSGSDKRRRPMRKVLLGLTLAVSLSGAVGCQSNIGGQTLPSPWYITDDPQYFPAGSEFKLRNEANAMKARALEQRAALAQPGQP